GTDYDNLIVFTNSLATLYRAGIPLLRAMTIMKIGPANSRFNIAIEQITFGLQAGKPLSQAMEEFDDIFPKTYRASIAAGEESGHLDDILDELSVMLEKEMELTRQIKSGIRYPLMVISAIFAAFVVIISYVVPKFIHFYGSLGAELPLPTRIVMAVSDAFVNYWWLVVLGIGIVIFGIKKLLSVEWGKLWFDTRLLKIPVFGNLIIKGNVARFSLMFKILFSAGIPIVTCLQILIDSVRNAAVAAEITDMKELFHLGQESDLRSDRFKFFPKLAREMMTVGLESGSLDKMLHVLGLHYSREVSYVSRQITSILEPLLTLVLGIFILILALAIMLPMWNLINVFKG
ncbi:MAG: type II secretion system F family protein, partial [candidate division Zixibacteria bacterium]|nr:type II secretion system F family protein [candidate division Zixibacteria bacterium]